MILISNTLNHKANFETLSFGAAQKLILNGRFKDMIYLNMKP